MSRGTAVSVWMLAWLAPLAAAGAAGPDEDALEVRLVLHNAVFRGEKQYDGAPAILADLARIGDRWQRVWATAGAYSPDTHAGRVDAAAITDEAMELSIVIGLHDSGFAPGGRVRVTAKLKRAADGTFTGAYAGTSRGVAVRGRADAEIKPPRRLHRTPCGPAEPGEHPRLLFRKADLPALREKAKTPFGQAALAKMTTNAAGFALRHALTGERSLADEARKRVEAMMLDEDKGDKRVRSRWIVWRMEQAALAYDLCYPTWPVDFRRVVAEYLLNGADTVFYNHGRFDSHINWRYGAAHAPTILWGAGVAGLAIWGEQGPAPARPDPPHALGAGGGAIAPADGYRPGEGVTVFAFADGVMPANWIYAGPFPRGRDDLAGLGGRSGVRPFVGMKVTSGRATAQWRPIAEGKGYLTDARLTGGRTRIELTGPSGVAVRTMSYYYTVCRNDKDRWVRLDTGNGDVETYLSGVRLVDGDVVRLAVGLYPWLMTGPIGEMKPWGKTFAEPRLVEIGADEARTVIRRAAAEYADRLKDWELDVAQWRRTGGCDVRYLRACETAQHVMYVCFRELLGTGGFLCGDTLMQAMDGPNKYALMHRNVFRRDPCPTHDAADYVPRTMFCHPYRADGRLIGQEISGQPGFKCSQYPENGRDTALENFATLLPLIRDEWKPAALWAWQYHTGGGAATAEGIAKLVTAPGRGYAFSRPYGDFNTHPLYVFVNYPLQMKPRPPEGIMPLTWQAPDFGFYGFRNNWSGTDEQFIAQFFAGGYVGSAGTLRVGGLGQVWSHGLGDPARGRFGENVVLLPTDEINESARGKVTYLRTWPDGSGALTVDLDDVYSAPVVNDRGRAEPPYDRYGRVRRPIAFGSSGVSGLRAMAVDYSGRCGAPCLLAVVDRIRGGSSKLWAWQLESRCRMAGKYRADPKDPARIVFDGQTYPALGKGKVFRTDSEQIDDDPQVRIASRSFDFRQGDASLRATFAAPAEVKLELATRSEYGTVAKGGVVCNSSKAVFARGGDEFLVVMTIQRGAPPAVKVDGTGLGAKLTVGGRTVAFDGEKIVFGE